MAFILVGSGAIIKLCHRATPDNAKKIADKINRLFLKTC